MTCPRSSPWRNTFGKASAAFLLLALSACASSSPGPGPSEGAEPTAAESADAYSFEWAVQNYEAGKYQEAIPQFRRLRNVGASNPSYALVPFYLGMCYYRVGADRSAETELRAYLGVAPENAEAQEARLALLTIYERTQEWNRLLGLAAETDHLTLFQENRALLKLLWARALVARGEVKGARAVLDESAQFLTGDPAQSAHAPEPDRDLWGRYHFTRLLLDLEGCRRLSPNEVAGRKKHARRLYGPWLDASVDCYRSALALSERELMARESGWAKPAAAGWADAADQFGQRIQGYFKAESGKVDEQRTLQDQARTQLYRLLSAMDETLGRLGPNGAGADALAEERKRLDTLILSFARPS